MTIDDGPGAGDYLAEFQTWSPPLEETVSDSPPFSGGDGGDRPVVTTFMIGNADAQFIRDGAPDVNVTFDPENTISFGSAMESFSSRGPRNDNQWLKPDVSAPGSQITADAGGGRENSEIGGTSFSAPMVAGAAAILIQAYPGITPLEVKARLMNTGNINSANELGGSALAPISRIGGGEVRVRDAVNSPLAAWDIDAMSGGLTFGYLPVAATTEVRRFIRIRNRSGTPLQVTFARDWRYEDDRLSRAMSFNFEPGSALVPANGDAIVTVIATVVPSRLPPNAQSSGSRGGNPADLTLNEYDGYINILADSGDSIRMPFHALPRQAANIRLNKDVFEFDGGRLSTDTVTARNPGFGAGNLNYLSLQAVSPDIPEGPKGGQAPTPDLKAFGVSSFEVPEEFCGPDAETNYIWAFGVQLWEGQAYSDLPGGVSVLLDVDRDGTFDYQVTNIQLRFVGFPGDSRAVTAVFDLVNGGGSFFFFADHASLSSTQEMIICGSQIGLPAGSMADAWVQVTDDYFGGPGDALANPVMIGPFNERFVPLVDGLQDVDARGIEILGFIDLGASGTNPSELGGMLRTDSTRPTNQGGATPGTEAVYIGFPNAIDFSSDSTATEDDNGGEEPQTFNRN